MLIRRLGTAGPEVSALSLGSWRTFERIERDQGLAVMEAAREAGITFLDDARYDDETKTAPIPTGYSEVIFGELFSRSRYRRDEVVVANKLWWEFWPGQDAAAEVDASLERMGLDRLEIIYSAPVPEHLALETVVDQVGGLLDSGRSRHWGIVNWPGEQLERAAERCEVAGVPQPCCAQLPYNLVRREWVEGGGMRRGSRAERGVGGRVGGARRRRAQRQVPLGWHRPAERGRRSARTLAETAEAAGELAALAREWGTAARSWRSSLRCPSPSSARCSSGRRGPSRSRRTPRQPTSPSRSTPTGAPASGRSGCRDRPPTGRAAAGERAGGPYLDRMVKMGG